MLSNNFFGICVDVYKIHESFNYDAIYEVLSTLKNKNLKILIENYNDMSKNPIFEQNHYSINSTGIYKTACGSIRLLKWICYCDRSCYDNFNYYYKMRSDSNDLNEIP